MDDLDPPLDPASARLVARTRRLMLITSLATFVAIAAVMSVIGYRLLLREGSAPPPAGDVTATLPPSARVVATAVTAERIVVTLEISGITEIRTFDSRTLQPTGRLQLVPAP